MTSASNALRRLRDGNRRFTQGDAGGPSINRRPSPHQAAGQSPFAIVLSCADSRVPVELIFDQGIGDLFVVRVAGNIAQPSQLGSIEYAATQLGTPLVVVLGHTHCGAVAAAVDALSSEAQHPSPNLRAIVGCITPALKGLCSDSDSDRNDLIAVGVRANVRASVEALERGSSIIGDLITAGELTVVGAVYSLEDGTVEFLDSADPLRAV